MGHFSAQTRKIFSKSFLSFSKKKCFLYFGRWYLLAESLKKILLFFEKKIFIIFQEGTFQARKNEKKHTQKKFLVFFQKIFFLYFREWNFLAPNLKSSNIFSKNKFFLYFRSELAKLEKQKDVLSRNFLYFLKKKFFPVWPMIKPYNRESLIFQNGCWLIIK